MPPYDRDLRRMSQFEARVMEEMEREQVRHCDLREYQPGQPHYERLIEAMREAHVHQWPSSLIFNV